MILNAETNQTQALNIIGVGYYFLDEIDSSMYYFNKSLTLSEKLDYQDGIARTANNR